MVDYTQLREVNECTVADLPRLSAVFLDPTKPIHSTEWLKATFSLARIAANRGDLPAICSYTPSLIDGLTNRLATDVAWGNLAEISSKEFSAFQGLVMILVGVLDHIPALSRLLDRQPEVYPMLVRLLLRETMCGGHPFMSFAGLTGIYNSSFDPIGRAWMGKWRHREMLAAVLCVLEAKSTGAPVIDQCLYIITNSVLDQKNGDACRDYLINIGMLPLVEPYAARGHPVAVGVLQNLSTPPISISCKAITPGVIAALVANLNRGGEAQENALYALTQLTRDIVLERSVRSAFKYSDGPRHLRLLLEQGGLGKKVRSSVSLLLDKCDAASKKLKPIVGMKCTRAGCFNRSPQFKLKKCSKCRQARYCSRECQVLDWQEHKQECEGLSENPSNTLSVGRTVALKYANEHMQDIVKIYHRTGPECIIRVRFEDGTPKLSAWKNQQEFERDASLDNEGLRDHVIRMNGKKKVGQVVLVTTDRGSSFVQVMQIDYASLLAAMADLKR